MRTIFIVTEREKPLCALASHSDAVQMADALTPHLGGAVAAIIEVPVVGDYDCRDAMAGGGDAWATYPTPRC